MAPLMPFTSRPLPPTEAGDALAFQCAQTLLHCSSGLLSLHRHRRASTCRRDHDYEHLINFPKCSTDSPSPSKATPPVEPYDAVIVGSGLGGLSTGALLCAHNRRVIVLEAHSQPGGAAHSFTRKTKEGIFHFESGPHLFSGLSTNLRNPMHSILRAANVKLQVKKYSKWGVVLQGKLYPTAVTKSTPFLQGLLSDKAQVEVNEFLKIMQPLGELATSLPPALIRPSDAFGTFKIMVPRMLKSSSFSLAMLTNTPKLSKPFAPLLHKHISDEFARRFFNLLCFLLGGIDAEKIPTAEIAFMLREWVPSPSALTANTSSVSDGDSTGSEQFSDEELVLEHPIGGASAMANLLVGSIQESGTKSSVRLNARVSKVLVDENSKTAKGVELSSGERIFGEKVICNVSTLDLPKLFDEPWRSEIESESKNVTMCPSFMHLHVALPLECLESNMELLPNYVVIADDLSDVKRPGNVVLVSLPSILDPDVAPSGFVTAHAYFPATEPYEGWENLKPNTEEYEKYKKERSKPLWNAVNKIFGIDVEKYAIIQMIGTPKTHERFLYRSRGSYGPEVDAGRNSLSLGLPWPSEGTLLPKGVLRVGDSVFPGIGVPAVAGSAWMIANDLVTPNEHQDILKKVGL